MGAPTPSVKPRVRHFLTSVTGTRRGILAAAALALAFAFVAMARQADNPTSTSDTAVTESFTLLASRGDLLLGPYSRFQWHHPGPVCFYWMAPFYVLSGARTTGLNAGALSLNVLALAIVAWTLVRRASGAVSFGTMVALALFVWRTPELLISPWNPHLPVFAIIALLVVAADAVSGTPAALPLTLVLASLAGQTHVALLPLAIAVGGASTLAVAIRMWRGVDRPSRPARVALASAAALIVIWLPTLVEQIIDRPGNLGLIWTFFASQSHHGQTFGLALSAWADMLAGPLRPDFYVAHGWRFVESPVRWAEALACAQLLGLVVVGARAWRRRMSFDASLAMLVFTASLVALWSATRIEDEIFDHAVFWMSALGVLNLGALAGLSIDFLANRLDRVGPTRPVRFAAIALSIVALFVGVGELRDATVRSFAPGPESDAARAVAGDVQRSLRERGVERPLVRFDQDAWGMVAGVVLQLQKAGVVVAVEDDWMAMYTPAFRATGREPLEIAIVGAAEHVRLSSRPGDRVVSSRSPLFAHLVSR